MSLTLIENLDPRQFIIVKNAKVNNLKNLSVALPRNQFIVITGLSGSGKSSLAFDTLFAEGQRMYVESLSAYARQFLGRMQKPEVEYIKGLSPAIAVEQRQGTKNPRATVGTTTEIYDYLKLLFARIGKTYSPISGNVVKKDTITDVVHYLYSFENGQRCMILAPLIINDGRTLLDELKILFQKGFTRVFYQKEIQFIEDLINLEAKQLKKYKTNELLILIDRNELQKDSEDNQFRVADSIQTAFYEGHGVCVVEVLGKEQSVFSDRFELDGMTFEEPTTHFFGFNSPTGACKKCGGFGNVLDYDEDLIIPNKELSVYGGAVAPWRTEKMTFYKDDFVKKALEIDFPIHRDYAELSDTEKKLLWYGNQEIIGIFPFLEMLEQETHKIQYRVLLSRFRGKITCPDCKGTRLRKDANYVKIAGQSISSLVLMPLKDLHVFLENLVIDDYEQQIAKRLLLEIRTRVSYLIKVGLGYLTLNRLTSTLSGGEYQRIRLATALGSALVGSMYILDEPSIGLHPRDTARLITVLEDLKKLGNTVIVVEHEEEIMRAADQIIDIGAGAGAEGGTLVFQGNWKDIASYKKDTKQRIESHTINFLTGKDTILVPTLRRKAIGFVEMTGIWANNLRNVSVKIPTGILVAITGVSGSGKSTLIKEVMYPALMRYHHQYSETKASYQTFLPDDKHIQRIEMIDQNPIGKSSRSNPATYTKVYDHIRALLSSTPLAKTRGYDSGFFSFNVDKGRCDVCQGEGTIQVEMQFMADIFLTCENCQGKRFKKEILEITYKDKNIADILTLTVAEALLFFEKEKKIVQALQPLAEVGLGYVQLGQSASTLSGGEAQRLKLASFLDKSNSDKGRTLFIFDEPTTGLHFHDIAILLKAFFALIEQGNTVWVIEHNLEIVKSADWIIDLGPEGGEEGGKIAFEGTPEALLKEENNYTASYLREKF
ncbi:MAG: excinuclease ABC subunit A [Cytophagales bacterium]|nr:MAG: excinuclease ABC subunit A [Cytophagales bacterium]